MTSRDEEARPMGAREHRLPSGARVQVWEAFGPARAMIQLQHGFAEYSERFVHQHHELIGHLTRHGFQVWAMDLHGHGRSPGRRGLADMRQAVTDHRDMRQIMRANGTLPVLLIGHSLGGLVTAGSALADPAAVRGVVLLAPSLPPALPRPARIALNVCARLLPAVPAPLKKAPPADLTRLPDQVRKTALDPLIHDGRVPLKVAATALHVAADIWQRAPLDWTVPCFIVHGTADTSTDPAQSRRLAGLLPVTDKTLHMVVGGRHELLHDLDGDDVLARVLTWLNSHITAQPSEAIPPTDRAPHRGTDTTA
ncbi:alpha/beta fold hydrolase [Streptomyces sp. NPDC085614]|uniref:alpha/beta fold hydrolase n=1 Tax=Streptomyces sp. NPDC085614 TaxID=3365733 RepID=UPI0037D16A30